MAKFVKFISATDVKLEVHINPDEVAAVRDSHGKTIILFR
ncbi:MAG: flagellar assembly protein FliH, partial [Proteobacteria bacterium]|nr:flagellar assembly protein FliH [Pseudomonadota bacterium]